MTPSNPAPTMTPVIAANAVPTVTLDVVPIVAPHAIHHVTHSGAHVVACGGVCAMAHHSDYGRACIAAPGGVGPVGGLALVALVGGPIVAPAAPPPRIDINALFTFLE